MPSFLACFGCGGSAQVAPEPPDLELSRDQLKRLYEQSVKLNGGRLFVHGIFACADKKNNNKRVYPMHVLKREATRFEAERIATGTALGEVDHPSYNSCYFRSLNLANVSHQVLDIQWAGDQLLGSIEILPTPSGLMLWELYSQGIKLGVSSRGWASLRTDRRSDTLIVDDDFDLITFDFVTDPSTQDAYLVPIQKQYKNPLPDQTKAVQMAFLGHGTCSIGRFAKLPDATRLAQHIKALQIEYFGVPGGAKAAPLVNKRTPDFPEHDNGSPEYLDAVLRYSHYMVYNDAAYLERERHARDFLEHVGDFATKAHLWDQCQPLGKRQRDQIFIGAKGAGCNLDRRQFSPTPPISGLDGQRPQNFGEASVPQAMPGGGMIAPLGGRTTPSANLSAETMSEIIRIKRTLGSYVAKCRERQETLRLTAFNEV